jgi:hypothetical protein
MSYETGAPPPPPIDPSHLPEVVEVQLDRTHDIGAVRPARGFDSTALIAGLGGLPPGTTTYRLRGTETTATTD